MHHVEGEFHGDPNGGTYTNGDKYTAGVTAWGGNAMDKFGSSMSYNLGSYDRLSMARAYGLGLWDDYSGCVLDAEGYEELDECSLVASERNTSNPLAALVDAFWARYDGHDERKGSLQFWKSWAVSKPRSDAEGVFEVQECLLHANGPDERFACMV